MRISINWLRENWSILTLTPEELAETLTPLLSGLEVEDIEDHRDQLMALSWVRLMSNPTNAWDKFEYKKADIGRLT